MREKENRSITELHVLRKCELQSAKLGGPEIRGKSGDAQTKEYFTTSMKYDIELPPDVERPLSACASEVGQDTMHFIQAEVLRFVQSDMQVAYEENQLPDAILDQVEIAPPFDLPRAGERPKSTDTLDRERLPDPPTVAE